MIAWPQAWSAALYGPGGFYLRPEGPAGHFRTAAHAAAPALAEALVRLAGTLGAERIVDVGAGRGELATAVAGLGLPVCAVDLVPRPRQLPPQVQWAQGLAALPGRALHGALVIAWELLDVIPLTVLEIGADGRPAVVLVDPRTGREHPGGRACAADLAWARRWWPVDGAAEGARIEVGLPRDRFWAALVTRARGAGAAGLLCVDYAHTRAQRPEAGSLSGFRAGRAVPPRPDGSTDLTAHVAIDAVAAAGLAAGATGSELISQASALTGLGVRARDLLDPGGLGGFAWLQQTC